MLDYGLLRLLADGSLHSVEELSEALGLDDATLRRRAAEIERLGLGLAAVRGKGYRLSRPLDLLDPRRLDELLGDRAGGIGVEIADECDSTNTVLLDRARHGRPPPAGAHVLVCERQTAGRGRRGNEWISAIGASLTLSMLRRFSRPAGELSGLSLAVAVAVARALEGSGAAGVEVKWPNDLMLKGRKLCGILIELAGSTRGPSLAVIGIGLNVALPKEFSRSIDQPAADLSSAMEYPPSRTSLLAAIVLDLDRALDEFSRSGFAGFRDEWSRRHAYQGRRATLKLGEREIAQGEIAGVAADGALLLRTERGIEPIHSGELSLR